MAKLLTNAFSFSMLNGAGAAGNLEYTFVSLEEARNAAATSSEGEGFRSVVGHADTAAIFADQLGIDVPFNRESVALNKGDELLIGQYVGPRLPEGVSTLPEGASIRWMIVRIS